MSEQTSVELNIEMNVECPVCGAYFDLLDGCDSAARCELLDIVCPSEGAWIDSHEKFEREVICLECGADIDVKGVEW